MVRLIIEELKGRASLFTGEYRAFYEQIVKDSKPVNCVPMKEVFTPEQMQFIKNYGYKARQKQCYKNASDLIVCLEGMQNFFDLPPIKYVEGYARTFILNIQHAFVRVGDEYIDPTFERVLKLNVRQEEYVSSIELDPYEMMQMQLETGYYGELYQYSYMKRFRPEMAAKIRSLNPLSK